MCPTNHHVGPIMPDTDTFDLLCPTNHSVWPLCPPPSVRPIVYDKPSCPTNYVRQTNTSDISRTTNLSCPTHCVPPILLDKPLQQTMDKHRSETHIITDNFCLVRFCHGKVSHKVKVNRWIVNIPSVARFKTGQFGTVGYHLKTCFAACFRG